MGRKPYPSDINTEECNFMAPYLTLIDEEALQRRYPLREMFNALRRLARACAPWRRLPNDFPPWTAVYQQWRRWNETGSFEAVDTMGNLLALTMTQTGEQERSQVTALCEAVQSATGETVKLVWADQGYTGDQE